jgi:hypothetical protein
MLTRFSYGRERTPAASPHCPAPAAAFQIIVGGVLAFLAGILIGVAG